MIRETFFLGYPERFQNICEVYPPKVNDVVGNRKFPLYKRLLTLSQEDIEDEFKKRELDFAQMLTPFEYLLSNAYSGKEMREVAIEAFELFCHQKVSFLYEQKKVLIGDLSTIQKVEDMKFLDEENFFDFQNLVRESLGEKPIEKSNPNEHPKIRAMKAKIRERERIKAKSGNGVSLATTLVSICCMNLGLNPLTLGELSYCAVLILVRQYQEKEKYQLDIDSLLAGADSKKVKPKYWMRDLENE